MAIVLQLEPVVQAAARRGGRAALPATAPRLSWARGGTQILHESTAKTTRPWIITTFQGIKSMLMSSTGMLNPDKAISTQLSAKMMQPATFQDSTADYAVKYRLKCTPTS